jgi:polyisoprenoid-binding protein YceI
MSKWNVDPTHSSVHFTVRHMVFAKVHGAFEKFDATLDLDDADLARSKIDVTIDAASINTKEDKRDAHLRSPDFFDVENHKKLTFKSKHIERQSDTEYRVTGDLTIHGVTREVPLDVELTGRGKDPWGGERMGFSAKTTVNRTDFGLKWNQALETGGVLVGEKVEVSIDLEVMKQKA